MTASIGPKGSAGVAAPDSARLPDRARVIRVIALLAMALFPWLIAPGQVQPDTKIDLTLSPWQYLARSLDAWNGHAGLGELQNQAYGYLFPMGPVFGIAHSMGIAPWATQRIWWSILLLVAFYGVVRLVDNLGLASTQVGLLGGVLYALCPRILTLLAENSSEAWPMTLAPWLLLAARPLLSEIADRRSILRSVALSGLLAAALGGVNATASALVLVVPFLYLLTHHRGRRRLVWWTPAVIAGSLWWLLPLLILGRFAYPFLDFIETAAVTTSVTSVTNVLRGNAYWVPYLSNSAGQPIWKAGWTSARSVTSILATTAVAGIGLAGVVRMRGHLARFALLSVVLGTLCMAIGYGGGLGSPLSEPVRALLDGPLAPLRNIHKADALIRLPVVLGIVVVLQRLQTSVQVRDRLRIVAIVVVVLAAMAPVWNGGLADARGYSKVPSSWSEMAGRIDAAAAATGGSTLLWPNARTSTYLWGSTSDDPMSALASSPVVVRAAAPLGAPGSTRMLDGADQLAASGQAQPGLAPGLARMGIARVVVRRSIDPVVRSQFWQAAERTMFVSPGFRYEGSTGTGSNTLTLWSVDGLHSTAAYAGSGVSVVGGPESVFDLLTTGVLGEGNWMRLEDAGVRSSNGPPAVVTDSLRWRALNSGVPTGAGYSPTLPASDATPGRTGSKDLPPAGDATRQPVRRLIGMTSWRASSSAADPFAGGYVGPGAGVAAAFDDDPSTAWRTGKGERSPSLSFSPTSGRRIGEVRVQVAVGPELDRVQSLQLTVGSVRGPIVPVAIGQSAVRLVLPKAATGRVTIDLTVAGIPRNPVVGLTQVSIPGQRLGSVIALPGVVDPVRTSVLIRRDPRQVGSSPAQGEDPAVLTRQVDFARSGSLLPQVWVRSLTVPAATLRSSCGAAGTLRVGSSVVPLRVSLSAQDARLGGLVAAEPCSPTVDVKKGTQQISVTRGVAARAELVVLRASDSPATRTNSIPASAQSGIRSGAGSVQIPGTGADVIALTQGFNAGWSANAGGRTLRSVEVDGWRQGFLLPGADRRKVSVSFAPTLWHRIGLAVGAGAVALLAALLLLSRRKRTHPTAPVGVIDASSERTDGRAVNHRALVVAVLMTLAVGLLLSGWVGGVVALGVWLVPARWLARGVGNSLAGAGLLLAVSSALGNQPQSALVAQVAGVFTVCLLVRRLGSGDEPAPPPVVPAG